MEIASVGNSANLHWLERYPELLFLLSYTTYPSQDFPSEEEKKINIELEGIDILYVYGVGNGSFYTTLCSWLKEKSNRRLVFLEDELLAIHTLLESVHAKALLYDPQVILHFLSNTQRIDAHVEGLVATYPTDRIEITAHLRYQKTKKRRFRQIRLKLLRKSTISHAIITETLYSHKLLGNLLRNIKQWPESFFACGLKGKFQGVPAIICGAGPSLQQSLPLLKKIEDRALVIAGGSAIAALSNQGVHPHLGIALDPNKEEFSRLKIASSFEMPLIYATRLQPDVFNTINGAKGYLVSETGGPCEHYFEKQMNLEAEAIGPQMGSEALSVTTVAIALAVEMGCSPILLNGIDLAYTDMQRYAQGVLPTSFVDQSELKKQTKAQERLLKRKNIHGHYVHTLVKWVMESECIASFAKAHPNTCFINVTPGGIGFDGIANCSLLEIIETKLSLSMDLRACVHAEIQHLKMPILKEAIAHEMTKIKESLLHLAHIIEKMIEELKRIQEQKIPLPTGKMTILEIDFQEEKAFECLFPILGPALDKLLSIEFPAPASPTEEELWNYLVKIKTAKYRQWKEIILSEIVTFTHER